MIPSTTHLGIIKTSRKSAKVRVIPIPSIMIPKPTGTHLSSVPGISPRNHVKCSGTNHAHPVPKKVHNQKKFTKRASMAEFLTIFLHPEYLILPLPGVTKTAIVRSMKRLILLSFLFPLHAADWPQWRGADQNNHAPSTAKPPIEWSEDKNVSWKTAIPGRGHSTPIFVKGRIYLTSADQKQINSITPMP